MAIVRPAVTVAAKLIAPAVGSSALPNFQSSKVNAVTRADATALINSRSCLTPVALTSPDLPLLDVDFCGEGLPLDQTGVVTRWKHVFTLFRSHASDLVGLRKKADDFFPDY